MDKNFDRWNGLKKKLDSSIAAVYANTREIWWCCFGLNIGTELYGKNELFERPVLIMKVYNKETLKVVPLTSKERNGRYFVPIVYKITTSFASLSQVRTMSTKRLSRKIGRIDKAQFHEVLKRYKDSI